MYFVPRRMRCEMKRRKSFGGGKPRALPRERYLAGKATISARTVLRQEQNNFVAKTQHEMH